ncbi:MAG: hypothetical protein ABR597_09975 [Bacteroidales bacterium]
MQLKKTDRLYLVASCKKDKANETDLNNPEEPEYTIEHLIDLNQDMEIKRQNDVLHDNLSQSMNNEIISVIGIEI